MTLPDLCADLARMHGEVVTWHCRVMRPELPSCLQQEHDRVRAVAVESRLLVRVDTDGMCHACRLSWHLAQAESAALALRGPVHVEARWIVYHYAASGTCKRLGEVEAASEREAWSRAWSAHPRKHLEVVRADDAERIAAVEAHGKSATPKA